MIKNRLSCQCARLNIIVLSKDHLEYYKENKLHSIRKKEIWKKCSPKQAFVFVYKSLIYLQSNIVLHIRRLTFVRLTLPKSSIFYASMLKHRNLTATRILKIMLFTIKISEVCVVQNKNNDNGSL